MRGKVLKGECSSFMEIVTLDICLLKSSLQGNRNIN